MQDIIDLKRFPLDRPQSAGWQQLAQRCRDDLDKEGMFNLNGFLLPAIAAQTSNNLAPVS